MKAPTAREKAEAHVALIRQEYPNPVRGNFPSTNSIEWYCVGVAAQLYSREHHQEVPFRAYMLESITHPNDSGDFETAWKALVDYYETQHIRKSEHMRHEL